MKSPPTDESPTANGGRRGFVTRFAAMTVGAIAALPPLAAGMMVFLNPLKSKRGAVKWVEVASLSEVPEDGQPKSFPIIADRWDSWNYYPPSPIGAVYLRRVGTSEIEAFTATCPHLGCFVEYREAAKQFKCPCHDSAFNVDGSLRPGSVSARGLDKLQVKLKGSTVIVGFQKFMPNTPKPIPQ